MHRSPPDGFGFLVNVQTGNGIGILSDGDQGDVRGVNYLVQGTYKVTDKLKFGLNYGQSKNTDGNIYNDVYNASFKSNEQPDRRPVLRADQQHHAGGGTRRDALEGLPRPRSQAVRRIHSAASSSSDLTECALSASRAVT